MFCTHLHIDHVGWNTQRADGGGRPLSPTPAIWSAAPSWPTGWPGAPRAPRRRPVRGLEDSVLPVIEAGLVDLVDTGQELARGLVLAPLPGHTMGQMGLRIDRQGGRAIFCGDAVHSPAQIFQPAVSTSSCIDPDGAAETRQILLEEAAATGRLVVPAHFRGRRRAYVRETGGAFAPMFADAPAQLRGPNR